MPATIGCLECGDRYNTSLSMSHSFVTGSISGAARELFVRDIKAARRYALFNRSRLERTKEGGSREERREESRKKALITRVMGRGDVTSLRREKENRETGNVTGLRNNVVVVVVLVADDDDPKLVELDDESCATTTESRYYLRPLLPLNADARVREHGQLLASVYGSTTATCRGETLFARSRGTNVGR